MSTPYQMHDVRREPYPTDYFLAYTILPLIPHRVRPNHVTIARLVLAPFVWLIFISHQYELGFWIFLAVALTDAIDGALARMRNQITAWGTAFDPIADKLLIGGTMLVLVVQHLGILAFVIVGFELLSLILGLYFVTIKKTIFSANWWGKTKMIIQVVAVGVLLIGITLEHPVIIQISGGLFIAALVFALINLLVKLHSRVDEK